LFADAKLRESMKGRPAWPGQPSGVSAEVPARSFKARLERVEALPATPLRWGRREVEAGRFAA